MARLIPSPPGGTPPNRFEQLVLETYIQKLPRNYQLLPNFILKQGTRNAYELDIVVLAVAALQEGGNGKRSQPTI